MASNWGGKREGSGRKKRDTTQLTIRVPNEIIEALKKSYPKTKDRNIAFIELLKKLSKLN